MFNLKGRQSCVHTAIVMIKEPSVSKGRRATMVFHLLAVVTACSDGRSTPPTSWPVAGVANAADDRQPVRDGGNHSEQSAAARMRRRQ